MREIKPRDTNDYFTQPRILQKDYDLHSQALPEDRVPSNTLCAEMKGNDMSLKQLKTWLVSYVDGLLKCRPNQKSAENMNCPVQLTAGPDSDRSFLGPEAF